METEMFFLKAKLAFTQFDLEVTKPPNPWKEILDPKPWETKYGKLNQCPKCGINLEGVMSYSCNHVDCPTGMGPVYCKT